jgi:hypothetical protein
MPVHAVALADHAIQRRHRRHAALKSIRRIANRDQSLQRHAA